ncbi:hypothetical protein BB381_00360 [Campylobacter pinnipediorum subsp. caledonicus]|uniref:hypothetical protein n=1 Tax=Campylobacter pinnipediorum TaxID=1965231 RepID=UPI000995DC61|nr:hypothetical protein [Campylobacter pinnipediorum]OPA72040.1 hypothetical protein BB381_00360 [Campylobacter pinnipediorum subsp. caledonicus]
MYYTSNDDVKNIINYINSTYEGIVHFTYKSLLTQTRLKEYMEVATLNADENLDKEGNYKYNFSLNYSETIKKFQEIHNTNPKKAFSDLAEFIDLYEDKSKIVNAIDLLGNFTTRAKDKWLLAEY